MTQDQLEAIRGLGYQAFEWRHATAILASDFPDEWAELLDVLTKLTISESDFTEKGGRKSMVAERIDASFNQYGWVEKQFQTSFDVDGEKHSSPTHKVDCYKNRIALELEWNNKDPFFDRDLNNFRLLFDLRAVSVGIILTKSDDLDPLTRQLGVQAKYGSSTTWMKKLLPRIEGGGGGGCPILVIGITTKRLTK